MQMRSSQQWWQSVKADPALLMDWLRKQYHGESMAAVRMRQFLECFGNEAHDPRWVSTVEEIARQEEMHASWVGELLRVRGEEPALIPDKDERYWQQTLPGISSWETGCAVAAHAEAMRLERIRVIAADPDAPADVRDVFARILPQEEFHERAFRAFSSDASLTATLHQHTQGAQALGLVV
jgi:rubrerythrin